MPFGVHCKKKSSHSKNTTLELLRLAIIDECGNLWQRSIDCKRVAPTLIKSCWETRKHTEHVFWLVKYLANSSAQQSNYINLIILSNSPAKGCSHFSGPPCRQRYGSHSTKRMVGDSFRERLNYTLFAADSSKTEWTLTSISGWKLDACSVVTTGTFSTCGDYGGCQHNSETSPSGCKLWQNKKRMLHFTSSDNLNTSPKHLLVTSGVNQPFFVALSFVALSL